MKRWKSQKNIQLNGKRGNRDKGEGGQRKKRKTTTRSSKPPVCPRNYNEKSIQSEAQGETQMQKEPIEPAILIGINWKRRGKRKEQERKVKEKKSANILT